MLDKQLEISNMGKHPEISVIVPVFNVERYIERCARSLFDQTMDAVEYIFVDDCSSDNSMQIVRSILQEYPSRVDSVVFINQERNKGVSATRNVGLQYARGKYVFFCDSDDRIEKTMLQQLYMSAEINMADVVICDFYIEDKGTGIYRMPDYNANKILFIQNYIKCDWNVVWNLLIRRDLILKNELYFFEGCPFCEDFNFTLKILDTAEVVMNVHESLYYYNRMNTNSATHCFNERVMRDEQKMYFDVIEWFKGRNEFQWYIKEMSWRILKSKRELVLSTDTYAEFLSIFPESHDYIWSCPWLNFKLKLMMWCLVHHLGFVSVAMLKLRGIKALLHK